MKKISLKLTAVEPLIISNGSAESMENTSLSYIPGNMLLGAMASVWIKNHKGVIPDSDDTFKSLFLNGSVKWGHAYPMTGDRKTIPVPLCFQKEKNHKGLPTAGDRSVEDCRIINLLKFSFDDDKKLDDLYYEKWPADKNSGDNQVKLKKLDNSFITEEGCCQPDIQKLWNMHVAIGNNRTASDGQLFGYTSLAKGIEFMSEILLEDELLNEVKTLLSMRQSIQVGHARSAGYGAVNLTVVNTEDVKEKSSSSSRSKDIIYLESDFVPDFSFYTPLESLKRCIENTYGVSDVRVGHLSEDKKMFCAYRQIDGFNSKWGLPRKSRNAIAAGSVFSISFNGTLTSVHKPIGGCTAEGYGRIRLIESCSFLDKAFPAVKSEEKKDVSFKSGKFTSDALLNAMRFRAVDRAARDYAVSMTGSQAISEFIETAANKQIPTNSQLGNLRQAITTCSDLTDVEAWFIRMLDKTPGQQWKEAEAKCPFNRRYENLNKIMLRLLNLKDFSSLVRFDLSNALPGGKATEKEKHQFMSKLHREFLLVLIKVWSKVSFNKHSGAQK